MGRKAINLVGQTFGRLTVIKRAGSTPHGAAKWLCKCNCPEQNEKIVIGDELRNGRTRSCGCYLREVSRELALKNIAGHGKTHGLTGTKIHKVWGAIKRRCYNKNDTRYDIYGGRGITVCEEWQVFQSFYDWAMANGYKEGLTIDRIDVNGNYEPSNCRWATAKEQANNQRRNHLITYNGKTQTIGQWAVEYNMPYRRLWKRICTFKWEIERALETP